MLRKVRICIIIMLILCLNMGVIDALSTQPQIAVVAPSSGFNTKYINDIAEMIMNLGYKPVINKEIVNSHHSPYHSNSDEFRLFDLLMALNNQHVKYIWAARGGYGSAKLIDELEKVYRTVMNGSIYRYIYKGQEYIITKEILRPKILIGFSDITVLHNFFIKKLNWKTVHGVMALQMVNDHSDYQSRKYIKDIIKKRHDKIKIPLKPLNNLAKNVKMMSTNNFSGGNLSLLSYSIGTPWELKFNVPHILILEEIGERSYKIDSKLLHLKQAGIINDKTIVIIADMINQNTDNIDYVISNFAKDINVPVFRLNNVGHGKTNYSIVFNSKTVIAENNGKYVLINYYDK